MKDSLQDFIRENIHLINQNTKESWEEIYYKVPYSIIMEFTKTILGAGINDPASIMGCIPKCYLYNDSKIKDYIIPSNVTSIGSNAFTNCSSLTSVVIPDTVIEISDQAFSECSKLTDVLIPNSVKIIGSGAFKSCYRLDSIKYNGTRKQWWKISHRGSMVGYSSESWGKIICSDGVIEL